MKYKQRHFRRIFNPVIQLFRRPTLTKARPRSVGTFEQLENRVLLSGTLGLDTEPPQVLGVLDIVPDVRRTAVAAVAVQFSEEIDLATFDHLDITLQRDGNVVPLDDSVTTSQVSGATYLINGLENFTGADGQYQLTVSALGIHDLAGNAGIGSAFNGWEKVPLHAITQAELDEIVDAARLRWESRVALTPLQLQTLRQTQFTVFDYTGDVLAGFAGNQILIDSDGGGQGWFIDVTPEEDSEFPVQESATRLAADPSGQAAHYPDLLTVVMRSMGNLMGISPNSSPDLLTGPVTAGSRRLPASPWDGLDIVPLAQLRTGHGFRFTGNFYLNVHGQNEKWFIDRQGQWHFLTPDGILRRWDGTNIASGLEIGTVDARVYDDPSLLFDVPVQLSPVEQAELTQLRTDHGFRFTGNFHQNFYGQNEKWFQDRQGQWHFLTPDGNLRRWNGSNFAGSPVIATITPLAYDDPNRLFLAPVQLSPAVQAELTQLRTDHGFYFTGNFHQNFLGQNEKWFRDRQGQWHFLTPDGSLRRWNGSNFAGSPVIATLDPVVYDDPSLLFKAPVQLDQDTQVQLAELQTNFGFQFAGSYHFNFYGQNEKWFRDHQGQWHFLTADGMLRRWNGSNFAGSPVIATITPLVYDDPTLLFRIELLTDSGGTQGPQSLTTVFVDNVAHFAGLTTNDLHLMVANGQLHYSETGTPDSFTNTGLIVSSGTVVNASVGGTVFLAGMDSGGGQYLSLGPVEINSNMTTQGEDLSISATSITVHGGIIVSTRQTATTADALEPDTASTGDSGSLSFSAFNIDPINPLLNINFNTPTITVGTDAKLLTNVEEGSSFEAGDIDLSAENRNLALDLLGFLTFAALSRNATIDVQDGAMINGADVTMTSIAGDFNPLGLLADGNTAEQWVAGLIGDVLPFVNDLLSVPISVIVKVAHARIEIGQNAQIISSKDVTLESEAIAESVGEAIYKGNTQFGFSFAFAWAQPTAETLINSSARIIAEGDVDLSSTAEATTEISSRVTQNIAQSAQNTTDHFQFAAGVGRDKLKAHTIVSENAQIIAGGSVTVAATGKNKNKVGVESASYIDGKAGLTFGLNITDSDIKAEVDGHITAGAANATAPGTVSFNPFTQIQAPNSVIDFGSTPHGFQTGDRVSYDTGFGGPVGGLESGNTYFVIKLTDTKIQLAASLHQARAGQAITFDANPTLTDASDPGKSVSFTQVDEGAFTFKTTDVSSNQIDLGRQAGFTNGAAVVYSTDGTPITGLQNNGTYYVLVVIDQDTGQPTNLVQLTNLVPVTAGAGTGTASLGEQGSDTPVTFNASDVNGASNTINVASHNLTTGQAITYTTTGTAIGGLTNGRTYYVIEVDDDNFQLAASQSDSLISLAVDLDPAGASGIQSVGPEGTVAFNASAVDSTGHTITFAYNHNFFNGQEVTYRTVGTNPINGLTNGENYHVIVVSDTVIKLVSTNPLSLDATGATGIQILSVPGTIQLGFAHSFASGDPVIYRAVPGKRVGTIIDGQEQDLVDGQTYFAVVDPHFPTALGLSLTPGGDAIPLDLNPLFTSNGQTFIIAQIDTETNSFTFDQNFNYNFTLGQPLVYHGALGTKVTGLVDGQTYYAIPSPTEPNTIQIAASLSAAQAVHANLQQIAQQQTNAPTITPQGDPPVAIADVNPANNTLEFLNPVPNFTTGQEVTYTSVAGQHIFQVVGNTITPLADGTYFVIADPDNDNVIQLAASQQDASNNIPIQLSADPLLTGNGQTLAIANADPQTSRITFRAPPTAAINTGDAFTFSAAFGNPIFGLIDGTTYYAIVNNEFGAVVYHLAATPQDAADGKAITFTPQLTDGTVNLAIQQSNALSHTITLLAPNLYNLDFVLGINGVDTTNQTIALQSPLANSVQTGDAFIYRASDGLEIAGLIDGQTYYVIRQDSAPLTFIPTTANVSSTNNTITFDHETGLSNGERVTYNTGGGAPITGLTNGGIYYVIYLDASTIQLTDAPLVQLDSTQATGTQSFSLDGANLGTPVSFNAQSGVDATANTITFSSAHGLSTGMPITYNAAGAPLAGLTPGATYYAVVISDTVIQLAASQDDALAPGPIVLSLTPAAASITQSFTPGGTISFDTATRVDDITGTIRFGFQHGLQTGQAVTYHASGGTPIDGLQDGETYHVIAVTATNIQLASSPAIHLDASQATGTHSITGQDSRTIQLADSADNANNKVALTNLGKLTLTTPAGTALTYVDSYGMVSGLQNGTTYFLVPTSNPLTIQLAATEQDAVAANPIILNLGGAVDLGEIDPLVVSGISHTLTAFNPAGISITATLTSTDSTKTKSGTGSEPGLKDVLTKPELHHEFVNAFRNLFQNVSGKQPNPVSQSLTQNVTNNNTDPTKVSVAGSFLFQIVNNEVTARVGSTALLQSGKDVQVQATVREKTQTSAEATVVKPSTGGPTTLAAAFAINVGIYSSNATATIEGNATVDAPGTIEVHSNVTYPFIFPFRDPSSFDWSNFLASNPLNNIIVPLLDGRLGLQSFLVNGWARSVAKAGQGQPLNKFGIAASILVSYFNNTSEATIGAGAKINQDPNFRTDNQWVNVNAENFVDLVNLAGIIDLGLSPDGIVKGIRKGEIINNLVLPLAGQASKVGLGISAPIVFIDNTTTAKIYGGTNAAPTQVHTGAQGQLNVLAHERVFTFTWGQTGGKSLGFGFSGTGSSIDITTHTLAQLEGGVHVSGPGSVNVNAIDDTNVINIAGSIEKGNRVGFGLTIVANTFNRHTYAIIGDQNSDPTSPTAPTRSSMIDLRDPIFETGDINVSAHVTGNIYTLSYAAADEPGNQPASAVGGMAPAQQGSFGLALSGDAALNLVQTDHVQAYINDLGTFHAGDVNVSAQNDSRLIGLAGTVALARGSQGTQVGLAGSFTWTSLDTTSTTAYVTGPSLLDAESLTITASRGGLLWSLTAGAAVAAGDSGIGVTGSASVNTIKGTTEAALNSANVSLAGDLTLSAHEYDQIWTIAGAVGYGGKVGGSAAFAYNEVAVTTRARIADSTITQQQGDLTVSALSNNFGSIDERIISFAGSLGAARSGAGVSGTGAYNRINNTTEAYITNTTDNQSPLRNVFVTARDDSGIISIAGGIGFAIKGNLGFGAAVADNEITNTVRASLDGAHLTLSGAVIVSATSDAHILSVAVGVAGAQNLALAGSVALNKIDNTVTASILDSSNILAGGAVILNADDTSTITTAAGGLAIAVYAKQGGGSSLAVGFSVGISEISNTIEAIVNNSTVSGGSVTMTATSTPTIKTYTIGGAGAGEVPEGGGLDASGAGAGSRNTLDNTITVAITGGSEVTSSGDIELTATDSPEIVADAGGFAIALLLRGAQGAAAISVGLSVAVNVITDTVRSRIDRSKVSGRNVRASATTSGSVQALTIGATIDAGRSRQGLGLAGSGAGAGSGNTIQNKVSATISNSHDANSVTATGGTVTVSASDTSTITADAGGVAISIAAGGQTGGADLSIGISAAINDIENTITAGVDNSVVSGSGGNVSATSSATINALTIGGAGAGAGSSEGLGLGLSGAGAGSGNTIKNTVTASTTGSSNITTTGAFSISASDTSNITADAGGVAISIGAGGQSTGAALSVGISVAINDIENTIASLIDTSTVSGGSVSLNADSNATVDALTIGGALAGGGSEGMGLAGTAAGAGSGNTIKNTVTAAITNSTGAHSVQATSGALSVSASDTSTVTADSGGFAIDVAVGLDSGGGALSVGISVATNDIENTIAAAVGNSAVSGNSVHISATSNATITARTLGGAGAGAGSSEGLGLGLSGAGAGSGNTIKNTVSAKVTGSSHVTTTGAFSSTASDTSSITADAGGFAIAVGASSGSVVGASLSVGVSVAINDIENTVEALVHNSIITAGSVALDATSNATINGWSIAGAGAGAGSSEGFGLALAGAGAGSGNTIANTITAAITGGSEVTASAGDVRLTAKDISSITADGGGFAVAVAISASEGAAGAVSVGASGASTDIGNTIEAYIDGSTVTGTNVKINALSENTIKTLTIGGAVDVGASVEFAGLAVSLAGSGSGNTIHNTVKSYITGGTSREVTATGDITLSARDTSDITGDAGGVALSGAGGAEGGVGVSVGLAIVTNDIRNTIESYIDNGKATATGQISLTADSTSTIRGYSFGATVSIAGGVDPEASIGAAFAGTGAQSTSTIENTIQAYIQNHSVVSGGSVRVAATNNSTIDTQAGGGSLTVSFGLTGLSLGIDVVLAKNTVSNTVQAWIGALPISADTTTVTATSGTVDVTASSDADVKALAVAVTLAASVSVGTADDGGGASATNTTSQTITAFIRNDVTVNATGAITVSAASTPTLTADVGSGDLSFSLVGASVSVSLATNTAGDMVQSFIHGANVTSSGGDVKVSASSTPDVTKTLAVATTIAATMGAAGSGANATAKVQGTTEAFIGGGAAVTASSGNVDVQASSSANANAESPGGSGSTIEITVMLASATIENSTRAHVSGGATVTAGGVNIAATATNSITSEIIVVGVAGISGDGGRASSTDNSTVEAFIGQQTGVIPDATHTTVTAPSGTVTVQATSTTLTNDAQANGGDAGGIDIAALVAKAENEGATRAYVGSGATVTASELAVLSSASNTATTSILIAQVTVAGGDGANTSVTDSREVEAFIGKWADAIAAGPETVITVTGTVNVQAALSATGTATARGGTGGAINVGALVSSATSSGTTRAYLGQEVDLHAGNLQVQANVSQRDFEAHTFIISISLAGSGAGSHTEATISGETAAFVGPRAGGTSTGNPSTLHVGGNINIEAMSVASPAVTATVGSGGVLAAISGLVSTATVNATTRAYVGDHSVIAGAGNLTVTASATDQADNTSTVGSGGILSGRGTNAQSIVTPTIEAYLGDNVSVNAAGNVDIEATSVRAEAHATGNSYGGGGIDVGIPTAKVTTGPTVHGFIGSQTTVTAGGNVTVKAAARSDADPDTQNLDDFIHSTDPNQETILFEKHGQQTGNVVVYVAGSTPIQTPSGPLATSGNQRELKVIVVDANVLRFGAEFSGTMTDASNPFSGSGVDPTLDVIRFAAPHYFESGDAVIYNPNGNTFISNELDTTSTFFVRKIDDTTIKLTRTHAEAVAPLTNFSSSQVSGGDTFNFGGFNDGDQVTYRAPAPVFFFSTFVNIELDSNGNPVTDSEGNVVHDPNANNIYLGDLSTTTIELQTGDQVRYLANGNNPINGLQSGDFYYIIRRDHDFQFAATQADALNTDTNGNPDPIAISLTAATGPTAAGIRLSLIPTGIGGLTNGKTYTVTNATAGSFQLIDPATGNVVTGLDPSLTSSLNTQQIGKENGIPLQVSTGTQDLHFDLTNTVTIVDGNKLLGPGDVSLRTTNPPAGDGQAFASASGGSGGVVEADFPSAEVTVSPTVKAYVAAQSLSAGGDVTITAATVGNSAARADNSAGGVVEVGDSGATTSFHNMDKAFVGIEDGSGNVDATGVNITAGGNFTVSSTTSLTTNVHAKSHGGGFVAVVHATATAEAKNETMTVIGNNATITANTVNILAHVTGLSLTETPDARAGGAFGSATATARNHVTSTASVLIGGDSNITGYDGVDVRALNQNVDPNPQPDASFDGIGPHHNHREYADGDGDGDRVVLNTSVHADSGTTVFAGPRAPDTPLATVAGSSNLALYVEASDPGSTNDNISHHRPVFWDANVTISSGANPFLLVDPDGNIVRAVNVSVNDGGVNKTSGHIDSDTIVVNPITNLGGGEVWFRGDTSVSNSFHFPLFSFDVTYSQVTIINESNKDLEINKIDVINQSAGGRVVIQSPNASVPFSPFNFDIRTGSVGPTRIEIAHTDPQNLGDADILLNDLIENPIGQTIITNQAGNILSNSSSAIVRTNTLDIQASGNIGAEANRINVQLVQSENRDNESLRTVNLTAEATSGSVYLDLTGRRRDGGTDPFTIFVDSITAGIDVDVLIQSSLIDPGISGNTGGIIVELLLQSFSNTYFTHFSPDGGSSGPPLDPAVFADMDNATTTASTYDFRQRDQNSAVTGDAGLIAGGNILVNAAHPNSTDPEISIIGITDLLGMGYIDTTTNGPITLTEANGAMRIKTAESTNANITLTVPDLPTAGQDLFLISTGLIRAAGEALLQVGDNVDTATSSLIVAGQKATILGDYGNADPGVGTTINISGSLFSPLVEIFGNEDNDTINLNFVNGINAGLTTAVVVVDGRGGTDNRLKADDSEDPPTVSNTGAMTASTITGLGMGGSGIQYENIQDLEIDLGQGDDVFTVQSTNVTTFTKLFGNGGNDIVEVLSTAGPLEIDGGLGDDTIYIGDTQAGNNGDLDHIQGQVTVIGGGDRDSLFILDHGATGTFDYIITSTSVTNDPAGPARTFAGVFYNSTGDAALDTVTNLLVDGTEQDNTFTVQSTSGVTYTKIFANGGDDVVIVFSTAGPLEIDGGLGDDTIYIGDTQAGNNGDLDRIQGEVNVIGGGGADSLFVNDHGATGAFNYIVTPNSVVNDPATIPTVPTPTTPPARTFAGVFYNNTGDAALDTVLNLRLDGTEQPNQFTVSPSQVATYTINGDLPPFGTVDGDCLILDTSHLAGGTGHRRLHITSPGNGFWDFTDGVNVFAQTVFFLSIECFNHVAAIATGADAHPSTLPIVNVRDAETGELKFTVQPYESFFHGGVRVATGDVDGDGIPDLIVAPGPGRPPTIKIYSGAPDANGNYPHPLIASFNAYSADFLGGVFVAVGDVTGDGRNELITGADAGGLPQVRVFDGQTLLTTRSFTFFNAFESNFRGGVRVAVGDINNDGYGEIVVARGPGATAQVNVFNGASYASVVPANHPFTPTLVRSIFPFGSIFNGGAFVAVGDVNGDGVRDISVGADAGWLPRVTIFSGAGVYTHTIPPVLATFLAHANTFRGGVRVATHPVDGGNAERNVVVTEGLFMGFGPNNLQRNVALATFTDGSLDPRIVDWVFEDPEFIGGIFVG